jgi:hypothetical protein
MLRLENLTNGVVGITPIKASRIAILSFVELASTSKKNGTR